MTMSIKPYNLTKTLPKPYLVRRSKILYNLINGKVVRYNTHTHVKDPWISLGGVYVEKDLTSLPSYENTLKRDLRKHLKSEIPKPYHERRSGETARDCFRIFIQNLTFKLNTINAVIYGGQNDYW